VFTRSTMSPHIVELGLAPLAVGVAVGTQIDAEESERAGPANQLTRTNSDPGAKAGQLRKIGGVIAPPLILLSPRRLASHE